MKGKKTLENPLYTLVCATYTLFDLNKITCSISFKVVKVTMSYREFYIMCTLAKSSLGY